MKIPEINSSLPPPIGCEVSSHKELTKTTPSSSPATCLAAWPKKEYELFMKNFEHFLNLFVQKQLRKMRENQRKYFRETW